jgi:hypothetical protein
VNHILWLLENVRFSLASGRANVAESDLLSLNEIKRNNKKRLEIQRLAYMQLLEYIRERGHRNKGFRVTESERRIFDALKIITEANWVINGG